MQYRREIDGLRAVAVIPVILFHAGFTIFSGGYVGVDIFFVISGYLITSIIISELEQGKFSILRFYERRARRILPALFLVMLSCIPFAWMWMVPSQFKEFSQSLVAVSVFASNILFWQESGYFAAASEEKPLLHTWSLAVEEQYYMLFPIFLILVWRFGRSPVFYSIIVISIISLLLSEWGWRNKPGANFYLAPTRAWELLAGSICAFLQYSKVQKSNNILSALGLALIVFAIFFYDESTPFPSAYALAPVVGTALIIMYGAGGTWVAGLLSLKGFVGIGLISYSAYLWHQPLFAFARVRNVAAPEQWLMLLLAVVSLVLAYFSWRYVEHPFRKRRLPALRSQRAIFGVAGTIGAAFIVFGAYGYFNDGISTRTSISGTSFADLNIGAKVIGNSGLHTDCEGSFTQSTNCISGDAPKILLWGDSFAMHLAQALIADDNSLPIAQHTKSACSPILGIALTNEKNRNARARECISFNNQVFEWLNRPRTIDYVVLSSPFRILSSNIYTLEDGVIASNQFKIVISSMEDTISQIRQAGKKPIVISPPPNNGINIGKCLSATLFLNTSRDSCDFSNSDFSNETILAYSFMEQISRFVPVIMLDEIICSENQCDTMIDGIFIYRDSGHLSKEGSHLIGATHSLSSQVQARADAFWEK